MASTFEEDEIDAPRRASAPASTSSPRNRNRLQSGRVMSIAPSFVSVTTIALHGNCPHCRHWHNKLKLSLNPLQYRRVHCQNCKKHWFSLGGNSTHTSLLSQETRGSVNEDLFPALALAICSSATAPLAFATPGFQETQSLSHLTAVAEDQSDPKSSISVASSQSSNVGPSSPVPGSAAGDPSSLAQAQPQPQGDPELPIPKGHFVSPKPAPKPLSRTKRRLKKVFAHLGFDVELRISRIKSPPRAHQFPSNNAEKPYEHEPHPRDFASHRSGSEKTHGEGGRRSEPFQAAAELSDPRTETLQSRGIETNRDYSTDTKPSAERNGTDTVEKRKQRRHEKTMIASASLAKHVPVRCICQPGCPCKRSSVSSARAVASQSAPDLFFNFNGERSESRALDYLEFQSRHQNHHGRSDGQHRSISPELIHTGGAFPNNMPRPSAVAVSEDSQDLSDRSRQASHITATSQRFSGSVVFSESPRGSATLLAAPVPSVPSPAPPPSPRSPLYRSSMQDDQLASRRDSESVRTTSRILGRWREESGSDMDSIFDRRHSSSAADVQEPRSRFASLGSVTSYSTRFKLLNRPLRR